MNRNAVIALVVASSTLGFVAGRLTLREFRDRPTLINPLLDPVRSQTNYLRQSAIQSKVEEVIKAAKENRDVLDVGISFRDFQGGPAFGISENLGFVPASLLKVPLMINLFKIAESDPAVLAKTVVYSPQIHDLTKISQLLEPPERLEPGKSYSVEFLLNRAITLSDNTAASMLLSVPGVDVDDTLKDMGLHLLERNGQVWLTVRDYATIFRILYNGQYLQPKLSSRALDLLTKCEFREGLQKYLPADLPVAHKFGERTLDNISQFHDCGIVYHPDRTYLLCVMSRGEKMERLVETVAEISKAVYEQISANSAPSL